MRALFTVVVVLFLIPSAFSAEKMIDNTCRCMNDGKCAINESGKLYCSCPHEFIDSDCSKEGVDLSTIDNPANITEDDSYYFIEFNTSTLYYVEVFFCPLHFHPDSQYYVKIEFEEEDGSLEKLNATETHSLTPHKQQCSAAKYVILPFKRKHNGNLIRLIIQIRSAPANSSAPEPVNQMMISHMVYEFYKLNGESIGQFLVISTLTSTLLICLTFTICRRVMRRGPRFVYQPAEAVRDITFFDALMPPTLYPADPQVREEDKECMICLLNVEKTMTRTTPCGHLFHKDCIDEWGRKSLTCPTCRTSLGLSEISL